MKFDFKKRVEIVEIGERKFEVEVSNYEFIKKAEQSLADFTLAQEKLKEGNIDALLDSAKTLIEFMLGDWDYVWDACFHDIYNLTDLCVYLSEIVKKGLEYKVSNYV